MARYEANYRAVRKWLNTDRDLRRAVTDQAGAIASRARVLAPVRTGRYKASIKVSSAERGWDGRVAAGVSADARYAAVIEVGRKAGRRSIHDRGHHVLRRAAESL